MASLLCLCGFWPAIAGGDPWYERLAYLAIGLLGVAIAVWTVAQYREWRRELNRGAAGQNKS